MIKKKKLNFVVGSGGHAKVVYDSLIRNKIKVNGVISLDNKIDSFFKCKIINEKLIFKKKVKGNFFLGIANNANMLSRLKIIKKYLKANYNFKKLLDRESIITTECKIGQGTQILKGSIIGPDVSIGNNCIVNTKCVIEHDVIIGNNCHIAPGSIILGGAKIGDNVFIGANSVIIQNKTISKNSFVKASSLVK